MRKCGVSGGGTCRRVSPHEGQISLRTMSARSQWPRAWHSGLIHCTVEPGMYCMVDSFGPMRFARANGAAQSSPLLPQRVTRSVPDANVMARIVQREGCGVK
jgi:hypothetical protein